MYPKLRTLETTISIIGLGHLGSSLCQTLHYLGYPITSVVTSKKETQTKLDQNYSDICHFPSIDEVTGWGKIIFITVPDGDISSISQTLSKQHKMWKNHIFIHCSGSTSSMVLEPLTAFGSHIAAWHPIQTFSSWSGIETFENGISTAEGSQCALSFLKKLTNHLKMNIIVCSSKQRQYIHLASVMISNYLITILNMTQQMIDAKLDVKSHQLYTPILLRTLTNIEKIGLTKTLTGPLVRGDINTLKKHISLLSSYPTQKKLYLFLAKETSLFIKNNKVK